MSVSASLLVCTLDYCMRRACLAFCLVRESEISKCAGRRLPLAQDGVEIPVLPVLGLTASDLAPIADGMRGPDATRTASLDMLVPFLQVFAVRTSKHRPMPCVHRESTTKLHSASTTNAFMPSGTQT